MRVLWFTSSIMPDHAIALGITSSPRAAWLPALAQAFVESKKIVLAVATNIPDEIYKKHNINGVEYYSLSSCKINNTNDCISSALINNYQNVLEDFKPDIIHIHGTEYFQGLLTGRGYIKSPTVLSIQGVLTAYQNQYWGGLSFYQLLISRTLRDWIRLDGIFEQKVEMTRRAEIEQEIFASNSAFIGRTLWDRSLTRKLNPNARYYHCNELIRKPFYDVQWNICNICRHTIFASSASYPLKGFHVLIKAVSLLRNEFPNIQIRTPLANFYSGMKGAKRFWQDCRSGGYARYLTDLICNEGLEDNIFALPMLEAEDMVQELVKAHVFVLPSFIENSPNSLAEAMLIGTPSIASFVGGVPSMTSNEETALLFSPGDETLLAEQIRLIFLDDQLAIGLSYNAQKFSKNRYCKEIIVNDMLNIYNTEIQNQAIEKF